MADRPDDPEVQDAAGVSVDTLRAADIAADDAGGGALGRNTGRTAGGDESQRFSAPPEGQGEIAADDAGGTAEAARATGE